MGRLCRSLVSLRGSPTSVRRLPAASSGTARTLRNAAASRSTTEIVGLPRGDRPRTTPGGLWLRSRPS